MTNNLQPFKSKGFGLPSYIFGALVAVIALFETFRGFPFAIVSGIGTFIVWTAVSTVIYARDTKFLGRLLPGIVIWGIGAFLIRLGGMTGITVFEVYMNLTLWGSILGATFFPEQSPNNPFGAPSDWRDKKE